MVKGYMHDTTPTARTRHIPSDHAPNARLPKKIVFRFDHPSQGLTALTAEVNWRTGTVSINAARESPAFPIDG